MDIKNPENIPIILSVLGSIGTFISILWVKIVKPIIKILKNQDVFTQSIETIKKELTTNGGNSLKDSIVDLKNMCKRIETVQKIMEQRTKAALHYSNVALFETDQEGRLTWTNNKFYEVTSNSINSVDGYDWLSYIDEDDRKNFLHEFKSCLNMNRKFVKVTKNCEGSNIKLIGFPYKLNDNTHAGFLISISQIKEL
jgi:PAS domain S-box-containing protein